MGITLTAEVPVPLTVSIVDPETLPDFAIMNVVPAATPVTSPELLIVATSATEEPQVTDVVMSEVILSEYVPVALY
jgi:hypothetical protein